MKKKRNVYLKMKTIEEARQIVTSRFAGLGPLTGENISVTEAVGRVLAEPVFAKVSSPGFNSAAMDGIAVRAEKTYGANESSPIRLELGKDAFWVNTGHVIPESTDAVIMIEHVRISEETTAIIEAPAYPWQYVRKIGEDIVATEMLFPRGHEITPYCVGSLLSGGITHVSVQKKPEVFIIPTGSELVDYRSVDAAKLPPGKVIESNSWTLGALAESFGGKFQRHDIISDDLESIKTEVKAAVSGNADIVFIIGGSSAGSEDYASDVISSLGEILVHGVTMMPGKPVIIGAVSGKPVFGIPGYPVSAIMAFEQFVKPIICHILGKKEPEREIVQAHPARKIPSKLGVEEFVRVKLGVVGERIVAATLPRGAGSITSITEADGIIRIPNHSEGIGEHDPVTTELLKPIYQIRDTVVIVGSHDNTLDVIADELRAEGKGFSLSSSHVGSMGGLVALKKKVCHLAGSHLLDVKDGTYNISYVKKLIPELTPVLVRLVEREQGLIVARGNPKQVRGIEDLARKDITFINRQAGSGTRILLDYKLKELNIESSNIDGYENEEYTHMSVAVAVLSGSVDTGLGIFAASRALGLDFIPVVTEQYDLVIPEKHLELDKIQVLLNIINGQRFRKRVETLGGYGTENTGTITRI